MGEIKSFDKPKHSDYPKEGELLDRIIDLVHEYDGEMSLAAATGILDMARALLIDQGIESV